MCENICMSGVVKVCTKRMDNNFVIKFKINFTS